MDLPGQQQRVELNPDIVDGGIGHNLDPTAFAIDFNLTDMRAIGKGRGLGRIFGFFRQPAGRRGDVDQRNSAVGTGNHKASV